MRSGLILHLTTVLVMLEVEAKHIVLRNDHVNGAKLARRAIEGRLQNMTNTVPTQVTIDLTEYCQNKNWTKYRSRCYRVFRTFHYFQSAKTICENNKGKLVSIEDELENHLVQQLINLNTRYGEAWIGLQYKSGENKYNWIDNSELKYVNWAFGQPTRNGDCVEMIPGGTWSSLLCYTKMQFVCEKGVAVPNDEDKITKIIIMITLPLACVSIMMLFVAYLCFRSHQELKSVPVTRKKTSQHFVDVVATNASIGAHRVPTSSAEDVEQQTSSKDDELEQEIIDDRYPSKKTKVYSSPNGSEKMYRQVTFV